MINIHNSPNVFSILHIKCADQNTDVQRIWDLELLDIYCMHLKTIRFLLIVIKARLLNCIITDLEVTNLKITDIMYDARWKV